MRQKNAGRDDNYSSNNPPSGFKTSLNPEFEVDSFINIKDVGAAPTPEYVPEPVATVFHEGAVSVAVGNWNAAGTMFRAAIDLATKPLLPKEPVPPEKDVAGLNPKVRRDLGSRLPWLFENGYIPKDLRELSKCVHQDGNDGAHAGTLTRNDAADLLDFTTNLLERLFTEPKRLELAKERRDKRRDEEKRARGTPAKLGSPSTRLRHSVRSTTRADNPEIRRD